LLDLAAATGELSGLAIAGKKPYDLATGLLRALRSAKPTVVVLEDMHWADEATLDVLRLLSRRLEQAAVLLVVSYRDDQLGRSHPLRIVLGDLPSGGLVSRVAVGALSRQAVEVLARPAGLDAAKLHRQTGGKSVLRDRGSRLGRQADTAHGHGRGLGQGGQLEHASA
jgi:hypothetical protein